MVGVYEAEKRHQMSKELDALCHVGRGSPYLLKYIFDVNVKNIMNLNVFIRYKCENYHEI